MRRGRASRSPRWRAERERLLSAAARAEERATETGRLEAELRELRAEHERVGDRVRHQPRVAVLAFHGALPERPLAPRGSLAASSIPVAPSLTRRSTRLPIVLVRGSGEPRSPVAASHQ